MSDHPAPSPAQTSDTAEDSYLPVRWEDPARAAAFAIWLEELRGPHRLDIRSVRLASADASFRRYLRVDAEGDSRIIMDAPADMEDCAPFAHVARLMASAGLRVPEVLAWDRARGFMLLSDLGPDDMMQALQPQHPQQALPHYLRAVDALVTWQLASKPGNLPPYHAALQLRELELFPEWYVTRYRAVTVDDAMRRIFEQTFQTLIRENSAWPSVYVHSDFMPRNLMLPLPTTTGDGAADPRIGILDFQDAVYGPITYDIASLMRDAFLSWEEDFVLDVTIRYWEKARAASLPVGPDFGAFYRAVEWMGLQRHLRVAGIFARLSLRDGKPRYLADTPRFIAYIRSTASRYRELKPLMRLVDKVEGIQDAGAYVFGRV